MQYMINFEIFLQLFVRESTAQFHYNFDFNARSSSRRISNLMHQLTSIPRQRFQNRYTIHSKFFHIFFAFLALHSTLGSLLGHELQQRVFREQTKRERESGRDASGGDNRNAADARDKSRSTCNCNV